MNSKAATIVQLIENNDLVNANQILSEMAASEKLHKSTIMLQRRITANQNSFNNGMLSQEDYSVESNKIAFAQLDLLSQLEKYPISNNSDEELAEQYFNFGNKNLNQKLFHKSIFYFSKAIIANPALGKAYAERGVAKWQVGVHEDAITDIQTAVKIAPLQPFAFFNLGNIYYQMGEMEKACENWLKVRKLGFDIADNNLRKVCEC